ncbi:hypothetical protein ACTFIU_006977 [Dictyostelium citrinum]
MIDTCRVRTCASEENALAGRRINHFAKVSFHLVLIISFYETKNSLNKAYPISPTIFALVVECMASAIIADKSIRGLGIHKTKILQFADDTTTISERYLGFNFNKKGIDSKIPSITSKIKAQLQSWEKISSTYQGRSELVKRYGISQLTFHTCINTTPNNNTIENTITKYLFNHTFKPPNSSWITFKTKLEARKLPGTLKF